MQFSNRPLQVFDGRRMGAQNFNFAPKSPNWEIIQPQILYFWSRNTFATYIGKHESKQAFLMKIFRQENIPTG